MAYVYLSGGTSSTTTRLDPSSPLVAHYKAQGWKVIDQAEWERINGYKTGTGDKENFTSADVDPNRAPVSGTGTPAYAASAEEQQALNAAEREKEYLAKMESQYFSPKTTEGQRTIDSNLGHDTAAGPGYRFVRYPNKAGVYRVTEAEFNELSKQGWVPLNSLSPGATFTEGMPKTSENNSTLDNILKDPRVTADKGVNGVTMAQWLQGNASLLPKLSSLGYTTTDLINEAYAQTRYNRSAFTGDMMSTSKEENNAFNFKDAEIGQDLSGATDGYAGELSDNGLTPEQKAQIEKLNADIDGMNLSIEQKAILKEIAAGDYTSGQKIPDINEINRIIEIAATNSQKNLDPYYQKIEARDIEDLRNSMEDIRNQAARFQQQEKLSYQQQLAQTKQSLRASGLTFSGRSKEIAGTEGFVKTDMEGSMQQQRRYNWEDQRAGWQEAARDLGTAAERQLGSTKMPGFEGLANPYGNGITYDSNNKSSLYLPHQEGKEGYVGTGDLDLERIKELEKAKWDAVSKYRANI